MNTTVSLPIPAQAVALDRAALLAALSVTGRAQTSKGHAFHAKLPSHYVNTGGRPYSVTPTSPRGLTTWHESAALAVARLVSL